MHLKSLTDAFTSFPSGGCNERVSIVFIIAPRSHTLEPRKIKKIFFYRAIEMEYEITVSAENSLIESTSLFVGTYCFLEYRFVQAVFLRFPEFIFIHCERRTGHIQCVYTVKAHRPAVLAESTPSSGVLNL